MARVMAPSDPDIGRLALADLPDAEALVAKAGWNQVGADWRIFLDFGTVYAVRDNSRVIATAATLPYGGSAWIGMVLVASTHRRRGLATRLLHRCIAEITGAGLVPVLDATPAGREVYARLGFEDAWSFIRLASQRRTIVAPSEPHATIVMPITDSAWPDLCAYDARASGADRSRILARMRGRLPPANLCATREGRIVGCLLGRDGRTASHLGPLIAEDDAAAVALLMEALRRIDGPVLIDVADAKTAVRQWLEASGFSPQRPFTRMHLGAGEGADDPGRTFAVIGPEFG
jgi:GNAT superfamily N-acetyltransferase